MYWLQKLKIIDKSPVWLSKAEEFQIVVDKVTVWL